MNDVSTATKLIRDASAALASAEEAIARIEARSHRAEVEHGPGPRPRSSAVVSPFEPATEDAESRVAEVVSQLESLDDQELDALLREIEVLLTRYVTAAIVYNRILAELIAEGDVATTYRDTSGRLGVRAGSISRVMVSPRQSIFDLIERILENHDQTSGAGEESAEPPRPSLHSGPQGLEQPPSPPESVVSRSSTRMSPESPSEGQDDHPMVTSASIASATSSTFQLEMAAVKSVLSEHARHIEDLRENLVQQATLLDKMSHWLDYLSLQYPRRFVHSDTARAAQSDPPADPQG